jgi:tetratricopeptide (TPR) repeat protein
MAENERLKGNESMKSSDFKDAIKCYSKSLELYRDDPATFSNRALAYLKSKEYARALEDAETAIKMKPDYIKAYHRRGKAYSALNKLELAIRDFQYILEKEPNNKDAMNEIKTARKKLDDKLGSVKKSSDAPKAQPAKQENKFHRVAIQEESDEDEEQAENESKTFEVSKESIDTPKE